MAAAIFHGRPDAWPDAIDMAPVAPGTVPGWLAACGSLSGTQILTLTEQLCHPWYAGNILFAFAVTGQALRWFSLPFWRYTFAAMAIVAVWIPFSSGSYGMAGVAMLTASWLLCRAQTPRERIGYGILWAIIVLLMNPNDAGESLAGLAIALLVLMVCSSVGERVRRFWPRHFFVLFYALHLAVLGIVATM
ncbi:TraX family protein [Klebsiella pasteurii]|uniref:TraX family protein n=1 Tax=Klebsiella pasteurii TaxID=2587529 RepID=UPI00351747C9